MKIQGIRADGALHISVGRGTCVILRGAHVTPPVDETMTTRMGPWRPVQLSRTEEIQCQRQLDRARTLPLDRFAFSLSMSFDERRERVQNAIRQRLGFPASSAYPMSMDAPYIPSNGIEDDWVVYCYGGKHYGMGYAIDESGFVSFDGAAVEVRQTWETLTESDATEMELATPFMKKLMERNKKNCTEMPGSLPNLNPSAFKTI